RQLVVAFLNRVERWDVDRHIRPEDRLPLQALPRHLTRIPLRHGDRPSRPLALAVSPDGSRLAVSLVADPTVLVYDAGTLKQEAAIDRAGQNIQPPIALDRAALAVAGPARIERFEVPSGKRLDPLEAPGISFPRAVAFSADGKTLVSGQGLGIGN